MRATKRFMPTKKRQQPPRRFYYILLRHIRILISSLVIPLIFGALTVYMTKQQLKQSDKQWINGTSFAIKQDRENDEKFDKQWRQTSDVAMKNQET